MSIVCSEALGHGADRSASQLAVELADLPVRNYTFPGEVLTELAVDAFDTAESRRASVFADFVAP